VPASTGRDLVEQRILEQSMRLPTTGAVTAWAALRMHGASFFDGLAGDGVTALPVPLALAPSGWLRPHPAVRVTYDRLPASEVVRRHGVRVVTPERALFDQLRQAPSLREAVVAMDMAVAGRVTSPQRIAAYVASHPGHTAVQQARDALPFGREHSRSPNETRLRLVWVLDAALPDPALNCPVHDRASGRLLGIADLLDLEAGLAVEFDGAEHRGRDRHVRDVAKEEAFRSRGIEVTRVTGPDLLDRPLVVGRLLAARSRARWEPEPDRAWVAVPPEDRAERLLREREEWAAVYERLERDCWLPDVQ
jgi:hypothetical protein